MGRTRISKAQLSTVAVVDFLKELSGYAVGKTIDVDSGGSLVWVNKQAVITPAPPTLGVVNNDVDTFGFTVNPNYPLISSYEQTVDGITYATCTVNPIVVGDVAKANGVVGVRVKATGNNTASDTLWNQMPYTLAPPTTDMILQTFLTADVSRNVVTNEYSWIGADINNTFGQYAYNATRKLMPGTDGMLYMKNTSRDVWMCVRLDNNGSWYGGSQIGFKIGSYLGQVHIFVQGAGSTFTGIVYSAYTDFRMHRISGVWKLEGTNDSWATSTVIHTYTYTDPGVTMYPILDFNNATVAKVQGAKTEGFILV